jgi:hypothetical protein
MPGIPHEVMVAMLREQPSVLAALVQVLTGRTLVSGLAAIDSTVRFVQTAEVRPDVLLADGPRWAVVEVQNKRDPDKQRRWLLAAGVLLNQTGVLGDVLVITARRSVAAWALTVAHLTTPLGTKLELTPVVLYVSPETLDLLLSEQHPELAVVATWAVSHRNGPRAKAVVVRALEVTQQLPKALQEAQRNAILTLLSARMLAWLEETQMDPAKIPMSRAALEFKARIGAQARNEGLAEGRTEGRTEGLAEGKRGALLALLGARGLPVTGKERAAIEGCADPATLDGWIVKAATAGSVGEVLEARLKARAKRSAVPRAAKRRAAGGRAR